MNVTTYGIEPLTVRSLSISKLTTLSGETLKKVDDFIKTHARETYLIGANNRLKTQYNNYKGLHNGKAKSDLVIELDELDIKRDHSYQTFVRFVGAYTYVETPVAVSKAYKRLAKVLKDDKVSTTANHQQESGQLNRLLAHLAEPANQEAIATLNLQPYVATLIADQAAFERVSEQRVAEQKDKKVGYNKEQKEQLIVAYEKLIMLIAVIADNPSAPAEYQDLVASLNAIRKRYATKSRKKTKDKENVTEETTPEE